MPFPRIRELIEVMVVTWKWKFPTNALLAMQARERFLILGQGLLVLHRCRIVDVSSILSCSNIVSDRRMPSSSAASKDLRLVNLPRFQIFNPPGPNN